MRMLRVACLAGAIVLGSAVVVSPAHAAKDCRDLVSATSRSTAKVSDQEREQRATRNALAHWRVKARQAYGWRYRFWSQAQERNTRCGGGKSAKHCTVSARPCRLF
jgi:hypothetical protein